MSKAINQAKQVQLWLLDKVKGFKPDVKSWTTHVKTSEEKKDVIRAQRKEFKR